MNDATSPGRVCPLHYRYAPRAFARPAELRAETIYVIGGLYGNHAALDAILALADEEPVRPLLVFNGDFHWFDVDPATFAAIDDGVLRHTALRGNVETELAASADDAGCGCAYPDDVEDADVARSNDIMRRLRATAANFPARTQGSAALPMHAVAEVGAARIGIVHGDPESLAGWRFAQDSLHLPENARWLEDVCRDAELAGFASSHTCLPALRRFGKDHHFVINNGAAGMPNFSHTRYGLVSRLSVHPAREDLVQYGTVIGDLHVDALPVHYDHARFNARFLADWPEGSAAHRSYWRRIERGPAYAPPHALGLVRAPSVCG